MAINHQTERTQSSEVVRTEARALLELAMRLDGPMAAPFARAVELLAEAVQHLKFPGKTPARPSIGDFESLEALRQKLLRVL